MSLLKGFIWEVFLVVENKLKDKAIVENLMMAYKVNSIKIAKGVEHSKNDQVHIDFEDDSLSSSNYPTESLIEVDEGT